LRSAAPSWDGHEASGEGQGDHHQLKPIPRLAVFHQALLTIWHLTLNERPTDIPTSHRFTSDAVAILVHPSYALGVHRVCPNDLHQCPFFGFFGIFFGCGIPQSRMDITPSLQSQIQIYGSGITCPDFTTDRPRWEAWVPQGPMGPCGFSDFVVSLVLIDFIHFSNTLQIKTLSDIR
jgi:hypothetical protein